MSILSKYNYALQSTHTLALSAMNGISTTIFDDLALITGLNKHHLAKDIFDIPPKKMSRYQANQKKLNPRNSELSLKLLWLYQKGLEVFGELDHFNRWLQKPALGLGNLVPYQLLKTSTGINLIFEALVRIEYGDLS